MVEKLDFSLIVCEFDERLGPIPIISYPEIKNKLALQIASKSIDFLIEEEPTSAKYLAFLPFPLKKKKAIVANFEWKDKNLRGGAGVGSFSLIFKDSDDIYYYKYIKDIEPFFDEATEQLIELKTNKAKQQTLNDKLKEIHKRFAEKLKELIYNDSVTEPKSSYRSTNIIIQTILECILRAERNRSNPREGIIKSHLINYCSLKSTTADKYFLKLEKAGYISSYQEPWGQRTRIIYKTTEKGRERYQWFVQINIEIEAEA